MPLPSEATHAEALAWARDELKASPTASLDARILLEKVTGLSRAELIAADRDVIGEEKGHALEGLVARRVAGEPVAYIVGRQEFYGLDFAVGPGVLIPRPESEMLVEAGAALTPRRVLDLGTGSGALLLSVLKLTGGATGVGIDASDEALGYAARNRQALDLETRADLRRQTFAEFVHGDDDLFDLILANPPYIDPDAAMPVSVAGFEPHLALFATENGLAAHREIAAIIARFLTPNGSAFVEIGHDQRTSAEAIYQERLQDRLVGTKRDAAGHPRMVAIEPRPGL